MSRFCLFVFFVYCAGLCSKHKLFYEIHVQNNAQNHKNCVDAHESLNDKDYISVSLIHALIEFNIIQEFRLNSTFYPPLGFCRFLEKQKIRAFSQSDYECPKMWNDTLFLNESEYLVLAFGTVTHTKRSLEILENSQIALRRFFDPFDSNLNSMYVFFGGLETRIALNSRRVNHFFVKNYAESYKNFTIVLLKDKEIELNQVKDWFEVAWIPRSLYNAVQNQFKLSHFDLISFLREPIFQRSFFKNFTFLYNSSIFNFTSNLVLMNSTHVSEYNPSYDNTKFYAIDKQIANNILIGILEQDEILCLSYSSIAREYFINTRTLQNIFETSYQDLLLRLFHLKFKEYLLHDYMKMALHLSSIRKLFCKKFKHLITATSFGIKVNIESIRIFDEFEFKIKSE